MTKIITFILLLFTFITAGYSQTYVMQIDSLLGIRTSHPFNGVVLISQNGKTTYSKVCGYSNFEHKTPLKLGDRFVIGSISKQITSVIVLQEYEKGHIKLNEPIRTYLPELSQSWADTVTIRHLLTHMHGIAELNKPTVFPVGTQFDYGYSSLGYDLLAKIVEKTSGKSFTELSMNLFAQCKMNNTFHPKGKKFISWVKGYTVQADGVPAFDTSSFRTPVAAGAFISTASDLAHWNENLFGGKLLKKEAFTLLTTKQPGAVRNHPVFGTTEYGLGITIDDQGGILQWGQTGFADGFVSMDFYFPETRTSVIVLENLVSDAHDTKKAFSYHTRILDIMRTHITSKPIEESKSLQGKHQPKVMILGVFHFGESGDSYQSSHKADMLSDSKQVEIDALIKKISRFKPTKILIEQDRILKDSLVNDRYHQYLKGKFSIADKANEIYQIGFKLAKTLNHPRIYCSDASAEWFGTNDIDWDNFDEDAYLKSRNQYEKTQRYDYQKFYEYCDSLNFNLPLGEYLFFLNKPENSLKYHQVYLTNYALCGAGDNYYGADSVGKWYRRNIRIFSNLYDIADFGANERILLIYGASHVWTLRQFIQDSPDFEYIEVNSYLK